MNLDRVVNMRPYKGRWPHIRFGTTPAGLQDIFTMAGKVSALLIVLVCIKGNFCIARQDYFGTHYVCRNTVNRDNRVLSQLFLSKFQEDHARNGKSGDPGQAVRGLVGRGFAQGEIPDDES